MIRLCILKIKQHTLQNPLCLYQLQQKRSHVNSATLHVTQRERVLHWLVMECLHLYYFCKNKRSERVFHISLTPLCSLLNECSKFWISLFRIWSCLPCAHYCNTLLAAVMTDHSSSSHRPHSTGNPDVLIIYCVCIPVTEGVTQLNSCVLADNRT